MTRFILADCNNFFVSCERLFNPKLEGKPVIVLSNNDGCVVARSQEAKRLNIQMGVPFFQIRDFCRQRDVQVFSSNFELYGDISERVMCILTTFAEEIEIYSIDEAFLKLGESASNTPESLFDFCANIKRTVKKHVGIPISLGIAPTKTLAKAANHLAKRNREIGVFDLSHPAMQDKMLADFPIRDIWGIGSRTEAHLHALGIFTADDLRKSDPLQIRKKLGVVGERIVLELRGMSCLELAAPSNKQSITCSRSFGKVVYSYEELAEAISTYANTACIKLRGQGSFTKTVCVYVEAPVDAKSGSRGYESASASFTSGTNDTAVVIRAAKRCLSSLYREGSPYKKCGIILLDLVAEQQVTYDLFEPLPDPRRQRLLKAIDEINANLGKNTLFYGAMGTNPQWKMKADCRSSYSTLRWEGLPVAKA